MFEFTAKKEDLKKAFSVVSLAVDPRPINPIWGQALFKIKDNMLSLYTTNKDMMSSATIPIEGVKSDEAIPQLTSDPEKIHALIKTADVDRIRFSYKQETKTLSVYASEDPKSYLSFASCDPDEFLTFESEFSKAIEIKKIDSNIFLYGLRFIRDFLPTDDKIEGYQDACIENGLLYASDGATKKGIFHVADFDKIDLLALRKPLIAKPPYPIISFIENADSEEVCIKSTSRIILISSLDNQFNLGFLKATKKPAAIMSSVENTDIDGFSINRDTLLKKLHRLSIVSNEGTLGIGVALDKNQIVLQTLDDRESVDSVPCERLKGTELVKFITEYQMIKNILGQFKTPTVEIYVDIKRSRFIIQSDAKFKIETPGKEPEVKSFKCQAIASLARIK